MKDIASKPERVTVKILRNGVHVEEGSVSLNKGAVVSVSKEIADLLLSKGLAK